MWEDNSISTNDGINGSYSSAYGRTYNDSSGQSSFSFSDPSLNGGRQYCYASGGHLVGYIESGYTYISSREIVKGERPDLLIAEAIAHNKGVRW